MNRFWNSQTAKDIRDTLFAIVFSLAIVASLEFIARNFSRYFARNTYSAIEASYKPGVARNVEYDYIRVEGTTYIVFVDRYSGGSISVVPK